MNIIKNIFLTVVMIMLSMTIINGEETSEETKVEVEAEVEVETVVDAPEYVGVDALAPGYLMELEKATAEGHMPIDILIQSQYLKLDRDAFIYMDKTYVPLRSVAQAFGLAEIVWDPTHLKATVTGAGYSVEFLLNKSEVLVNGEVNNLGTPAVLVDGHMMVPLAFITQLLEFEVIWDATYYTVGLIHPSIRVSPEYLDQRSYSYAELQNFAKLVMLEAGDTSYEVHHGVASVVMNRMTHPHFGSSVDGVIFNTEWTVQFPPAHKSSFSETRPNEKAIKAVKYTLRGQNSVDTCIFFNTRPFKGKPIYKVVDGVYFMQE